MNEEKKTLVFLVGFMGTGKSTLGKLLAARLGYAFIDTDEWIEKHTDLSIMSLFDKYGENHFRGIENYILRNLLTESNCVVSCGGGLPCFSNNIMKMNSYGSTIYLDTPPELLYNRLTLDTSNRPLLKNLTEIELKRFIRLKLDERKLCYEKAELIVKNTDLDQSLINIESYLSAP